MAARAVPDRVERKFSRATKSYESQLQLAARGAHPNLLENACFPDRASLAS